MLSGKVVWITGASRGIGQAIALACAKEGAQTVLVARAQSHLAETSRLIVEGGYTEPVLMDYDIADLKATGTALGTVHQRLGRIDALVNNAGVMRDALLGMITGEQIQETFAVNVYAAIYHMQYASRLMARHNGGSIVNISSIMGQVGNAGQVVYSASKAALLGATLSAAKELAPKNIRVNAIAPGFVDTDLIRQLSPEKYQARLDEIGMKRCGTPAEIANAVLFLVSGLSEYMTGQVLRIDGGMRV